MVGTLLTLAGYTGIPALIVLAVRRTRRARVLAGVLLVIAWGFVNIWAMQGAVYPLLVVGVFVWSRVLGLGRVLEPAAEPAVVVSEVAARPA
jgi:hypothetical protein